MREQIDATTSRFQELNISQGAGKNRLLKLAEIDSDDEEEEEERNDDMSELAVSLNKDVNTKKLEKEKRSTEKKRKEDRDSSTKYVHCTLTSRICSMFHAKKVRNI